MRSGLAEPVDADPEEEVPAAPPLNRMAIAVLSLVGIFIAGYLLLHKMGVIGTLTCGIGDCSTVQLSRWAVFLGVPVPAWGVGGYAALLAASLLGLQGPHAGNPALAKLILAMSTIAFVFSVYLTALEAFVIHAWCQWCVGSAVIATLIFGCSLVEIPRLRRRVTHG